MRTSLVILALMMAAGSASAAIVESTITSPTSIVTDGALLGLGPDEPFVLEVAYRDDVADANASPGVGDYPDAIQSVTLSIGPHVIGFDVSALTLVVVDLGTNDESVAFRAIGDAAVPAQFLAGPLTGDVTSTPDGSPFGFAFTIDYGQSTPLASEAPPAPLPPLGFGDALNPLLQLEIDGGAVFVQGQIPSAQIDSQVVEIVPDGGPVGLALLALALLAGLASTRVLAR